MHYDMKYAFVLTLLTAVATNSAYTQPSEVDSLST